MEIIKGKTPGPCRTLLYGTEGIGKSTWASCAPAPLFINLEDGLDRIDCHKTPWLKSSEQVLDVIAWLAAEDRNYRSVVVDTADWLETLIFAEVAKSKGKAHIQDIGYGKGYDEGADRLTEILRGLDYVRRKFGVHVIFLAHEKVEKFAPPGADAYDRYTPAMHKETRAVLCEWCEDILFASFKTFTKTEDLGFNKTRHIGIGGTQRYIRTTRNDAITAKNRLNLPDEIALDWAEYAKYFAPAAPVGNINGVVVNGSSKPQKVSA